MKSLTFAISIAMVGVFASPTRAQEVEEVRAVIERHYAAIHAADLETVFGHHLPDMTWFTSHGDLLFESGAVEAAERMGTTLDFGTTNGLHESFRRPNIRQCCGRHLLSRRYANPRHRDQARCVAGHGRLGTRKRRVERGPPSRVTTHRPDSAVNERDVRPLTFASHGRRPTKTPPISFLHTDSELRSQ